MKNSPESKFDKISANARESSESKSTQTHSKLAHFPIMLFASVMGIGGLSLAFKKASVAFGANADFIDLGVNFAQNQMQNLTNLSEIFECVSVF